MKVPLTIFGEDGHIAALVAYDDLLGTRSEGALGAPSPPVPV